MSSKQSGTNKFPTHLFHGALLAVVLSLAVFRFFIQDAGDRHHCEALLNEGRWLDSAHTSWQPSGCMLHPYSPSQVATCFEGRHIVFVGDSTVRQVFYAAVRHADKSIVTTGEKHSDRVVNVGKVKFSFYWDPFLNGTRSQELLDGTLAQSVGGGTPTLAVIGSGIWYLRHPSSGGFGTWTRKMDSLFSAVSPSGAVVADEVILLPVENAIESRLSPERAATVHLDDIKTMNEALDRRLHDHASSAAFRPTLAIPRVFNQLIEGLDNETEDGLHFSDAISRVQASILLNLRCNDVLPKKFPFDKTCCSQYPTPNWVQSLLLLVLLAWAPAGLYLYSRSDTSVPALRFFPEQKYLLPLSIFGLSVSLLFVADRTSLFLKENKQYDALSFAVLCLVSLGAGLATMTPAEKDLGFLNRDQTDEWKGWMQIAILIYHYVGASKISGIYNPIRVLVAAYLFQTGYGHLTFFLKKADFGFFRVASIVIRLNLLTVVLSYLMATDYLSYYFSPLVTIWFGIIWVTMWIGHQYNERTSFLLGKLAVAAGLTAVYFEMEGPLEATFSVLNTVFAMTWNAKEWRFRVTLDMWIVWIGMLTAFALIKVKEMRLTDRPEWPQWQRAAIIASAVTMFGYFVFELTRPSKFEYNHAHPYVSALPVLAFCVLRNATPYLRSTSSKFFMFFGKCSLETFIIQFHLFIAADTRGIIMMIPGGPLLRPLNFAVTSLIFVWVSNQVAGATGKLTEWICARPAALPRTNPPPRGSAVAPPPTGGSGAITGEYVALSTVGDGVNDEKNAAPRAPTPPPTAFAKGLGFLKNDLRLRFAAIVVGLWVLNEIYPATK